MGKLNKILRGITMHFNNIDTLETLAKQLHPVLKELSSHLLPTGSCALYHTCKECPFGTVMYNHMGIDILMCENLLNLEFRLGKIVQKLE
jgi:hypothetical protein